MYPWTVTMRAYNGNTFTVSVNATTAAEARTQAEAWCEANDTFVSAELAVDGPALGLTCGEPTAFYEPPDDLTYTVFDPHDPTFGPIMGAIQSGNFEAARDRLDALTSSPRRPMTRPDDLT